MTEAVQRKLEQALQEITGISSSVHRGGDTQALLSRIVGSARELLQGDMAAIALFDSDGETLTIRACTGPADLLGAQLSTAGTILGTVAMQERPEVVEEIAKDSRHDDVLPLAGVARGVFCPLSAGSIALGAIMVGQAARRPGADDATDLSLLALLAEQAASVIQTGKTLQEERFLSDKLSRLGGYLARAESGWEREGIEDLLREIAMATGADAVAITEEDDDRTTRIVDGWNLSAETLHGWNASATRRSPSAPAEAFSAVLAAPSARFFGFTFDLCVRVPRSGSETRMHLLTRDRRAPFRPVQVRLAEVVCVQVGALLDRVALLAQIRNAAEAEHSASLQLRALYEDIDEGILVLDAAVKVTFASRRTCHILHASPNELLGRNLFDAVETTDRMVLLNAVVKAMSGTRHRGEFRVGERGSRTIEFTCRPEDARDPARAVRMVMRDVTEERSRESDTLHREKLASVGELAAGVAHEINNPISFVLSNYFWLSTRLADLAGVLGVYRALSETPEAAPYRAKIEQMEKALRLDEVLSELPTALSDSLEGLERVRKIVADMRMFARKDGEDPVEVDVKAMIESALGMASPMIRTKAQVVRELSPLPAIKGFAGRLSQVFLNLIVNAAQAIPEGASTKNRVTVKAWSAEDGVRVAVSDTGKGIAPEHRMRLFTPFFTTKSPGEGTGLGLALAYEAVRRHGGRITVESEMGAGSTFTVFLPFKGIENPLMGPREKERLARGGLRIAV